MSKTTKAEEAKEISFSDAYSELKAITDILNGEEVEADELVDLLRRGKGLEAALRQHLTGIEQEVEAIERGEGIAAYTIVTAEDSSEADAANVPAASDFQPAEAGSKSSGGGDIPF